MDEGIKILLADDNIILLNNLNTLLSGFGYNCLSGSNNSEVEFILQSEPGIRLVLTDHHIPGNERLQMVKDIREKYPEIRIIVMSGTHTEETGQALERMQVRTYLQKPVAIQVLHSAIAQALSQPEGVERSISNRISYADKSI
jgi:solute carrier family 13 (sodium-dependent dicarboxylate transporter), member 2/3/5